MKSRLLLATKVHKIRSRSMGRMYQKHYVAIIIVFVPAFIINVWLSYDRYAMELRSISELGEQSSIHVGAAIEGRLASIDQNVRAMAWYLGNHGKSHQQIYEFIETMLSENPKFVGLVWQSDNGKAISVPAENTTLYTFDDMASDLPLATSEGVVFRQRATGAYSGMLFVQVKKEQLLNGLIDQYVTGWHTRVVDSTGQVIWGDLYNSCSAQGLSTVLGASRVLTMDVEKCLSFSVPVTDLGWTVELSQTTHSFLSLAASRGNTVLFLIAMASLFWVYLVVSDMLQRVQALQDAAGDIAAGDFSTRVKIVGADDITDAAISFNRMASRIQELETARDLFLQTAAHELRNPMAGVKGILSLVRRRVELQRPIGDMVKMLEMAEREADRTSMLLNEILDAFRSHSGQLNLRMERLNLVDVVNSAIAPYTALNEHRFVTKGITNTVIVCGDDTRLEQVVRNLVSNALKYSPPDSKVQVSLGIEGTQAVLAVADNGYGIAAADQPRLFEEFYRGSNAGDYDPGGLGLGLFISKQIVEQHGGSIVVESEVGKGTAFTIRLPLVALDEAVDTSLKFDDNIGA